MATEPRLLETSLDRGGHEGRPDRQHDTGTRVKVHDLEGTGAAALEALLRRGFESCGRNIVKTNGLLLSSEHLRLFRQYNVDVAVASDGPGEGSPHRAEQVQANIARLCREHRPPRILVMLHRRNATAEHLPRMFAWMRELDALGIRSVHVRALTGGSPDLRLHVLTDEEAACAFLGLSALQRELKGLRFDVVDRIERSLLGRDRQASVAGERELALRQTPQNEGGCKDCRFFLMCRGRGPFPTRNGEGRNRSELCGVWKRLYIHAERQLILANRTPLSIALLRRRGETPAPAHGRVSLPPFVRQSFAGEAQRTLWQPRFDAVVASLPRMALAAISRGMFPAALVTFAPEEEATLRSEAVQRRLQLRVLPGTGESARLRAIAGTTAAVHAAEMAWKAGDAEALDRACGLPACCRAAATARRNEGWIDAVWPAAGALADVADVTAASTATNVLFRPIGIDLLGYVPCSFDCEPSRARAEAMLAAGSAVAGEAAAWLNTILGWPVEWSALHGIAEVRTAIVRIAYATDYTPAKVTLHRRRQVPA